MEKLRAELLIISHQAGDAGTEKQRAGTVDFFLRQLQKILTPLAIEQYSPLEIRSLLYNYIATAIERGGHDEKILTEFLWVRQAPRDRFTSPQLPVGVESIFGRR